VLVYVTVATLSLPGGLVLTLAGGLLFGTRGGRHCRAWSGRQWGATLVFLIARAAIADAKLGDLAGSSAGCRASRANSRSCTGSIRCSSR
jgi:uncharacterized membrane protein YdjX (TVP38/TMEM64 family)